MRFTSNLKITLGELGRLTKGVPLGNESLPLPLSFATNSEEVLPGDCFVALEGEKQDGNRFLARAALHGAAMLICREVPSFPHPPTLLHHDAKKVLEILALHHYRSLALKTVAVTGSVGKTSAVAAIRAVLSQEYRVHAPEGNRNNALGLSITMLEAPKDTEVAVLEIGSNHPGEVASLSQMVRPHLAVITAVGRSHIGHFGSVEAICKEKLSIADGMKEGALLLPHELREYRTPSPARTLTFSRTSEGDFHLSDVHPHEKGTRFLFHSVGAPPLLCELQGRGEALRNTALIALSVGRELSLSDAALQNGIRQYVPPKGRGALISVGGLRFLDDGYNASPESMQNAFLRLKEEESRPLCRVALLGDMLELGSFSDACHEEIGEAFASVCDGRLYLFGKYALRYACGAARHGLPQERITVFPSGTPTEIAKKMLPHLEMGDTVLIKGSHATGAEEIQKELIARLR